MSPLKKKTTTIRSVEDFLSYLHVNSNGKFRLFRGQNTDQPLLPKIIRLAKQKGINPSEINNREKQMLARFRRESVPMIPIPRKLGDWELVSIAQHWGMPTRLLDWTANPLAGLWFAVMTDPPDGEDHGVIWVLPSPNVQTFDAGEDMFGLPKTCFFQPPHLDRRITAQSSWFSIYRHNRTKFLPLENMERYRAKIDRVIIPQDAFHSLRLELRLLGVHYASLFPDMSGLTAEIQSDVIDSWRGLSTI